MIAISLVLFCEFLFFELLHFIMNHLRENEIDYFFNCHRFEVNFIHIHLSKQVCHSFLYNFCKQSFDVRTT